MELIESNIYTYGVIPLLIALARVVDVSLGTIKIIYVPVDDGEIRVIL